MAARRYHRKERPQGARGKPFKLRPIQPGSKNKLSSEEIMLLTAVGVAKTGERKRFETPFGGMNDVTLTKMAQSIQKTVRNRTNQLNREEARALRRIQERVAAQLRKRHPEKALSEIMPGAGR